MRSGETARSDAHQGEMCEAGSGARQTRLGAGNLFVNEFELYRSTLIV